MRAWTNYKISECHEPLVSIPCNIRCIDPHPYLSLGAPYGKGLGPWRLRCEVVKRLIQAEKYLQKEHPQLIFLLFDAWRPIPVQAFMVQHTITQQCILRGINPDEESNDLIKENIAEEVGKFWAPPSFNPSTPPPHSTGAAVDLTLAMLNSHPLDMGGEIDEIGERSTPDYFSNHVDSQSAEFRFNSRRLILTNAMKKAGFVQHPNEWWHFSFGDQMWAWGSNEKQAIYGACSSDSNFLIE